MRSRKIRVVAIGVQTRLGPGCGELINVSLSGALVCLDHEVAVGSCWPLQMSGLDIRCEVVRCVMTSGPGQRANQWLIAVEFADVSRDAAKALRILVAGMYERAGAARA